MIVVDASIALLWVQPDDADSRCRGAKELATRLAHEPLAAPGIFPYEVANVIHHKRLLATKQARARATAAILAALTIDKESAIDRVGPLAEQQHLSVYDAAYVELAQRRAATLLTEDATLHAAGVAALGKERCLRLAEAQKRWP